MEFYIYATLFGIVIISLRAVASYMAYKADQHKAERETEERNRLLERIDQLEKTLGPNGEEPKQEGGEQVAKG